MFFFYVAHVRFIGSYASSARPDLQGTARPDHKIPQMDHDELNGKTIDATVALLKAVAGAIPVIGSTIAEIVGYTIPGQKLDRVAHFLEALSLKVAHLERDFLRDQMRSEQFTDLLEDALHQASRALTTERRDQIASAIANGITDDTIDHLQKKTLLSLFGQLNDVQVVMLTYFDSRADRDAISHRHARNDVLLYPSPDDGVTAEHKKRWPIQRRYWDHLCELGLLRAKYQMPKPHELPEFDPMTGTLPRFPASYEITGLGQQLLAYIGVF